MEYNLFYEEFENVRKYIPKNGELYWYIDVNGDLQSKITNKKENSFNFIKNATHLFKTMEEAEKYKEFLTDIYALKKEFVSEEENYYVDYGYLSNDITLDYSFNNKQHPFYFTKENLKKLLNKYGKAYIRHYLLDVWNVWE